MNHLAIVGASLAGMSAAEGLRDAGYEGRITVVDPQADLPPDRPPLSKQVLAGTMAPEAARQPAAARLDELDLDLRLGCAAEELRLGDRALVLSDGMELVVDGVVIATGATPRRLPVELGGVHVLRTMEDCLAIRASLGSNSARVVVVGAGFIGAEVAATCREAGHQVTMIEAQDRPMQRVLPGPIGDFFTELHRDHGVEVRLGVGVESLQGGDRVERVTLTDGTRLDADVVVAGIGVVPEVGWLAGSGLVLDNGIRCDETCRAAPGVVAAGDVAEWPNPLFDELMRVEQWENAIDQGGHAARTLLAGESGAQPYAPVPWFWTDQYDRKIQLAGRCGPDDETVIVDGSIEDRRFVALFRRGERCVGVLGVNRPRHVVHLRSRIAERISWTDALAAFEAA